MDALVEDVSNDIVGKSFVAMVEKYEPLGVCIVICDDREEKTDDYRIYHHYTFEVFVKNGLIEKIDCVHKPDSQLFGGDPDW